MKVELALVPDRVKYISELFETKQTVLESGLINVEFDVNDELDFLSLFHAGILCGRSSMINNISDQ